MSSDDDGDTPQLSGHALAALQEFYSEQTAIENESEDAKATKVGGIQEDWQLSQFWYDDETATTLAKEAIHAAGPKGRIACVSTPTLFQKLQQMNTDRTVVVFEYDRRFEVYGENFVFYDFREPLRLPDHVEEHSFDVVVGDPPFLSEECLGAFSATMKRLAKDRLLLCTGSTMTDSAKRLLGVDVCRFRPKHARNLANDFRCFANYDTIFLKEES